MADSLLSVADARAIVLDAVQPLPATEVELLSAPLGLVLAEAVVSDLDMPPFDKAMMDGYALRAADVPQPGVVLAVIEEVTAGKVPQRTVGAGQATRIMTGAPIPAGADAVVMIERTHTIDANRIRIDEVAQPGKNVLPRAHEMRRGDVVVSAGARLRPQEFGILAAVGRAKVRIQPAPGVALVATGDEIIDIGQTPGPGQIRNSNAAMLFAQVLRAGGVPKPLGIARDTAASLREHIDRGLAEPMLILSGGVSAGKLDLVPAALAEFGVKTFFHKVAMKPGKPMLFGVKVHDDGRRTYVFGLPGNPVSSLVCFELFVRPTLRKLMALPPGPRFIEATLAEDYAYRTDRPTYHPVQLSLGPDGRSVRMVPWFGSPDLRGLLSSNAFALLPVGDHRHRAGTTLPVLVVEEL